MMKSLYPTSKFFQFYILYNILEENVESQEAGDAVSRTLQSSAWDYVIFELEKV